jgi:ATP/maltotriose-dependent transcriptional regulator MalT
MRRGPILTMFGVMEHRHHRPPHGRRRPAAAAPLASLVLEPLLADPVAGLEALTPLLDEFETADSTEPVLAHFIPAAIECLVLSGRLERAGRVLDRFCDAVSNVDDPAIDATWAIAVAARCRSLLMAARGDIEAAEAAATEALRTDVLSSVPFEAARLLLLQGQLRRRRREKRAAEDSIIAALDVFEQLGDVRWAERARVELGRLGVRRAADELTPTEDHVARLAASGLSNKQVAASLFISSSTVKTNLAKVYCKLGVTGRAQLATAMAQRSA